jgi:hypothetical protein
MAKLNVLRGTTSFICHIFIQDTSKSDGSGLTGLVWNSGSLTGYYMRSGAASAVSLSLATITTLGTYAGSATATGFKEVDAANMPGVYELQPCNNALASGANQVVLLLKGATNMAAVVLEIQLQDLNFNDAVRAGLTALPNVAAEGAGGLYTRGSGAGQINQPANGQIDANTVKVGGTTQTARDLGASVLLANPQGFKKNAALTNFEFAMFDSTGAPKTGLSGFTSTRSIDGAAFAAGAIGAVAEVANGVYKCDLGAGDLNGDVVTFAFAAAGAVTQLLTIRTVVA